MGGASASLTSPLYVDSVPLTGLEKALCSDKSIALSDNPVLPDDADLLGASLAGARLSGMQTVPEPATLCLMGVGCAALLARRRRS